MSSTGFRRIGSAATVPRGRAINIPVGGYTGGGGEFGAQIIDTDRTFAVTREPVAHRVVFTVAHDIFDNWFELFLQGKEHDEASQTFDLKVQTELNRLKAKRELMLMSTFERAYGYAILVLGYEQTSDFELSDPLENPSALKEVKAYAKTQIPKVDVVKAKDDPRYGLPLTYNIKRAGISAHLKVHYSRVIHFATRIMYSANKHEWEGVSSLDPLWDDLVTLRNIRWGMGQTMYRYGSGFPDITFQNAELADIETWINSGAFSNLSARTYFAHNENQTLEFKGLQGRALDPMNYYLPIMENISCASGIPLAILRGVQAGALTGSEVNQQEYYGLISDEQSGYEAGLRELIDILIKTEEGEDQEDYEFNWLSGIELPEEKKTQIALMEAQTFQIKGQWHTRNELRKMEDPDAEDLTPEQGGDEILGKAQPFGAEGEQYNVQPLGDGSTNVTKFKKPHRH